MSISRTPSDYHPGSHFVQRHKERDIPGEAINECIENGEIEKGEHGEGRVKFISKHRGETYILVVDPDDGVVVTGFRERNEPSLDAKNRLS